MNLLDYDNKYVRITYVDGYVFEGDCTYNSLEYNEHEFGHSDEGLEIANFLLWKKDIVEIESLEDHDGPYGKFTSAYGTIEEMNVEDGIDSIREELFREDPELVIRMIRCLDDLYSKDSDKLPPKEELVEAMRDILDFYPDPEIRVSAKQLLERLKA